MTTAPVAAEGFDWRRFLLVAGPGLVVMLADTDAGSVITAAQSGAQWGYRLLLLQVAADPHPLYRAGTDRAARHGHRQGPRRSSSRSSSA